MVDVAITAPEGVEIDVSVNGSKVSTKRKARILQHQRKVKRGPDIER